MQDTATALEVIITSLVVVRDVVIPLDLLIISLVVVLVRIIQLEIIISFLVVMRQDTLRLGARILQLVILQDIVFATDLTTFSWDVTQLIILILDVIIPLLADMLVKVEVEIGRAHV